MTVTTAPAAADQTLSLLFQYTVEAYKTFQKLSEMYPNPMSAQMFGAFARDERDNRDLLEIKYSQTRGKLDATLGQDLRFQDMVEGELSYKGTTEFLINRERTMLRKLDEATRSAPESDRNLFHYISASKKAHIAFLERELELIERYPDWYRREDAETLIVLGSHNND